MMRNVWHISGGQGWTENTTNLRVLVVHTNNTEAVHEIKNDLKIDKYNRHAIIRQLTLQGVKDIEDIKWHM